MKKVLIAVPIALVAIVILATLIAAPVAKGYVNKHGKELLGRNIHVDQLKVNVYTGHVAIRDLTLFEDDDTTAFVSFDTLDVKARLLKLMGHHVYLKHITLAGLDVKVLQNGNQFNFTSFLDHFASDEPKPDDTTASDWKLSFYNIRISHGKVYYADLQRHCDWKLKDLNLKAPGFCIGGDEATDAGLTILLADGGTLTTDAHYDMNSNDFDVSLGLDAFALQNVKAYLSDFMNIGTLDGALNAQLKAQGNLSHILEMNIGGNVSLQHVKVEDAQRQPVLSLPNLAVQVNKINLADNNFDIASVQVDGLASRFDRYPDGSNFSHLMRSKVADTAQSAPADTVSAPARPMQLKVGRFSFKEGSFTYADHCLADAFEFPVTKISIDAEQVSLSGDNGARIMASLPHGGRAFINWSGSLDDIKRSQSLILSIKNLQMADLSPYTVTYLGYPFDEGTFSFTSSNKIRNSQLDGKNHLDIYKANVGQKRKDVEPELKIPLKAALYVLKDKDEKIQIDLPVAGNLDNPEFSYMKVVWKTLGNLLVKVATEPFRLAGNALGIGADGEAFIPVDPAQRDITSEQYYELDKYANAALQTPGMLLTLDMVIDDRSDSTVLRMAEFRNRMVARHLTEDLQVPESQLQVNLLPTPSPKKTGYQVSAILQEVE